MKSDLYKYINFIKMNLLFFNVRNKNVQMMAYREYCYKRISRKYKYVVERYHPIKEESFNNSNYIWICWLQGLDTAPKLVKKCIDSVRRIYPEKQIIILDENNISDYIDLPNYIIKGKENGKIPIAQYTDIIRTVLLNKYGGMWVDSTVYMTDKIDLLDNSRLFVFKNISLYRKEELCVRASNWFIYSNGNSNILHLTENLLMEYWKKEKYLKNYNLFHMFFTMASKEFEEEWNSIPTFNNINPHILQFELLNKYDEKRFKEIKKTSSIHKLNYRIYPDNKSDICFYNVLIDEDGKEDKYE